MLALEDGDSQKTGHRSCQNPYPTQQEGRENDMCVNKVCGNCFLTDANRKYVYGEGDSSRSCIHAMRIHLQTYHKHWYRVACKRSGHNQQGIVQVYDEEYDQDAKGNGGAEPHHEVEINSDDYLPLVEFQQPQGRI